MRRNKMLTLVLLSLASLSIVGCNKNDNTNQSNIIAPEREDLIVLDYEEHEFLTPSNETIKYSEKYKYQFKNEETEIIPVNEIKLAGNKKIYNLDGNIVKYKEKEFIDLYDGVTSIDKPCSTEALINFIVEYFNTDEKTVYCQVNHMNSIQDEMENIGEVDGDIEYIDEGSNTLFENTDFDRIYERYNQQDIEWSITVSDNIGYIELYGSRDYIVGYNLDRQIVKDYEHEDIIFEETEDITNETENNTEGIENDTNSIETEDTESLIEDNREQVDDVHESEVNTNENEMVDTNDSELNTNEVENDTNENETVDTSEIAEYIDEEE